MLVEKLRILFEGSKTFWRSKISLEICICEHVDFNCIEVIAYDPIKDRESPRIYINTLQVTEKIDPLDFNEKIKMQKESLLKSHKPILIDQVVWEVTKGVLVQYILSRLQIDNKLYRMDREKLIIYLSPSYCDTVTPSGQLDVEYPTGCPAKLQPYQPKTGSSPHHQKLANAKEMKQVLALVEADTKSIHSILDQAANLAENKTIMKPNLPMLMTAIDSEGETCTTTQPMQSQAATTARTAEAGVDETTIPIMSEEQRKKEKQKQSWLKSLQHANHELPQAQHSNNHSSSPSHRMQSSSHCHTTPRPLPISPSHHYHQQLQLHSKLHHQVSWSGTAGATAVNNIPREGHDEGDDQTAIATRAAIEMKQRLLTNEEDFHHLLITGRSSSLSRTPSPPDTIAAGTVQKSQSNSSHSVSSVSSLGSSSQHSSHSSSYGTKKMSPTSAAAASATSGHHLHLPKIDLSSLTTTAANSNHSQRSRSPDQTSQPITMLTATMMMTTPRLPPLFDRSYYH